MKMTKLKSEIGNFKPFLEIMISEIFNFFIFILVQVVKLNIFHRHAFDLAFQSPEFFQLSKTGFI